MYFDVAHKMRNENKSIYCFTSYTIIYILVEVI